MYNITIIGAGPAGLTAAIYAGRAKMKTLIIAEAIPGGQAMLTDEIENYPGFSEPVKGPELMKAMFEQTKKLDIDHKTETAINIKKTDTGFAIKTNSGEVGSMSVIYAAGAAYKKLNVKGEEEFTGRGVSYCGVCDAPFFKNKDIALIGGGDTALYEASHLLKYAKNIHVIHRRDKFRGTKIMQNRITDSDRTIIHWDSVVETINGDKMVDGITIKNVKTGEKENIPCQGVFIFIGIDPNSKLVADLAETNERGYIKTDANMQTNCPGLFACGDVRDKLLKQVSTAVGEAATAAFAAQNYVEELKGVAYK